MLIIIYPLIILCLIFEFNFNLIYYCVMTAAGLGNIIFFYIDVILYDLVIYPLSISNYDKKNTKNVWMKLLYSLLPPKSVLQRNRESISFFVSYLVQILAQHLLNALFVYGLHSISTRDKYISSLLVTYSSYSITLIGSTICNISLLRKGVSKNVAFWGTVFGFGIFNFFVLKYLIGDKHNSNDRDTTGIGTGTSVTTNERGANKNQQSNANDKKKMTNTVNGRTRKGDSNNSKVPGKTNIGVKNTSAAARKMRGGGFDYCESENPDSLNSSTMKVISHLFGLLIIQSNPLMAFVQSTGSGIIHE